MSVSKTIFHRVSGRSAATVQAEGELRPGLDVQVIKSYSGRGQSEFTLDADFQVQPGFTVLVGPSGAGKSTLLRCIAGLSDPDRGRIMIGERALFDAEKQISIPAAKRRVAFVFQHLALFPHLSVEENVGYGIRHMAAAQREPQIAAVLESFRIAHLRKQVPKEISGGEQQRVALARALVTEPAVLLLDEPLSSLDAHNKASIIADLQKWNEKHHVPILYVTHSQEEMFALGEHVIVFDPGEVMREGLPIGSIPRRDNPSASDFDNLLDATVVGEHLERGIMQCRIPGTSIQLEIPRKPVPLGSDITLRIPSHEIVLATAPPQLIGICNVIPGQILRMERMGNSFQLRIHCGIELRAELTPDAVAGIRAPGRVWLIIPPHACHFERVRRLRPLQRLFVFVCSGNTSRSPLAQAICNAEVARRLRIPPDALGQLPVRAVSAGIFVNPGEPMTEEAQVALQTMGLPRLAHKSQDLTPDLVASSDAIFCMTADQRQQVIAKFPEAAAKIHCLDPCGDIEDPHEAEDELFREIVGRLRKLVDIRLTECGVAEGA